MADQEDEDLKMAIRLSQQQHESPEPKRSKPGDSSGVGGDAQQPEESPEAKNRRIQRELMAAAAERRIAAAKSSAAAALKNVESAKDAVSAAMTTVKNVENLNDVQIGGLEGDNKGKGVVSMEKVEDGSVLSGTSVSIMEADKLFWLIFSNGVGKDVLAQWCNQGIR